MRRRRLLRRRLSRVWVSDMSELIDPRTGDSFEYKTRAEWGARPPKYVNALASLASGTFMHHTVTAAAPADAIVRGVQNFHMDGRGWSDIAYSFLVDVNYGVIYEGRGLIRSGGHTAGYNSTSLAICWIANTDDVDPTDVAKRAWNAVYNVIVQHWGTDLARGHRDVNTTGCPGAYGYAWLRAGRPSEGTTPPPPAPEPSPEPSPPVEGLNRYIGPGSPARLIKAVQGQLVFWGRYPANEVDGRYGPKTKSGVRQLQADLNSKGYNAGAEDGLWGQKTYAAYVRMLGDLANSSPSAPASTGDYKHQTGRTLRVTQPHMTGDDVAEWQFLMNVNSGDPSKYIDVDGVYGPATAHQTQLFQNHYAMFFEPIDVDGAVGPQTREALKSELIRKGIW